MLGLAVQKFANRFQQLLIGDEPLGATLIRAIGLGENQCIGTTCFLQLVRDITLVSGDHRDDVRAHIFASVDAAAGLVWCGQNLVQTPAVLTRAIDRCRAGPIRRWLRFLSRCGCQTLLNCAEPRD